jgi:hypothetical protein
VSRALIATNAAHTRKAFKPVKGRPKNTAPVFIYGATLKYREQFWNGINWGALRPKLIK